MIVPVGDQFVDVVCHAVNQIKAKLTGKRLSHIHDECFNQIAASNATAVTTITHTISPAAGSLHWLAASYKRYPFTDIYFTKTLTAV